MRAGAVQLNATEDTDRNLADRRPARPRRRRARRRAGRAAGEVERAGHARAAGRRGRSRSTGAAITLGARDRARARHRPRRRLDRRARRGPRRRRRTRASTSVPTARSRGVYRKIHMFDVEVDGVAYAESDERGARRRGRRHRARQRRPARDERLLRPALPRAVPDRVGRGRRGDRGAERVHAGDDARSLGGAAARARDREPVLRDRGQPDRHPRRGQPRRRALADRRSVGAGAGDCAPDTETAIVADLDFELLRDVRRRLPALDASPARRLRLARSDGRSADGDGRGRQAAA